MSGLQDGTSTLKVFLLIFNLQPNNFKILLTSWLEIEIPITFLNFSMSKYTILFFLGTDPAIENLLAFPPQIFIINAVATSRPSIIEFGSMPL